MEIVGLLLGCFVVGYAFTECARYVAAHRREETALAYPRGRLVRRLLISVLVLIECGVLVVLDREAAAGAVPHPLIALLALGCLIVIFRLLWGDFTELRGEIAEARVELSRSLHADLSAAPAASDEDPSTSV